MTPDDVVEIVAEVLGAERDTKRFFMRRSIDKSCYQVVHDLDPDGPISDATFKVISTHHTPDEAGVVVWRLTNDHLARAALEAARYGEMVEALVDLLPWVEKRPHAASAINNARALLSSIGASQ